MWSNDVFCIAFKLFSDYTSYSNLDASTGDYQEEGEFYPEEEEENLENYQGKIILLQSAKLTLSKAPWLDELCA